MVQHFLPGLGYPGSEERPLGTATEVRQLLQLVPGRCPDTQGSQQPFSKPQKEAFRLLSMSQEQASSLGSKRLSICKQEQDYPTLPFGDFPHHHHLRRKASTELYAGSYPGEREWQADQSSPAQFWKASFLLSLPFLSEFPPLHLHHCSC